MRALIIGTAKVQRTAAPLVTNREQFVCVCVCGKRRRLCASASYGMVVLELWNMLVAGRHAARRNATSAAWFVRPRRCRCDIQFIFILIRVRVGEWMQSVGCKVIEDVNTHSNRDMIAGA